MGHSTSGGLNGYSVGNLMSRKYMPPWYGVPRINNIHICQCSLVIPRIHEIINRNMCIEQNTQHLTPKRKEQSKHKGNNRNPVSDAILSQDHKRAEMASSTRNTRNTKACFLQIKITVCRFDFLNKKTTKEKPKFMADQSTNQG